MTAPDRENQALVPITGWDSVHFMYDQEGLRQQVNLLIVADTSTAPSAITPERLRRLATRATAAPFVRIRRRTPMGRGAWQTVAEVDPSYHVTHEWFDGTLTDADIKQFSLRSARQPLHPDRPLWRGDFLQERNGTRLVLNLRTHHSLLDGLISMDLMTDLLDTTADADPSVGSQSPPSAPAPRPSLGQRLAASIAAKTETVKGIPTLARDLVQTEREVARIRRAADPRLLPPPASPIPSLEEGTSPAPWAGKVSSRRANLGLITIPLSGVREIKKRYKVDFGDVVLAATAGAMRAHLIEAGSSPDRPLVCSTPLSFRSADDMSSAGNKFGVQNLPLPIHLDDPVERLLFAGDAQALAKQLFFTGVPSAWPRMLDFVPLAPARFGMWMYSRLGMARIHRPMVDLFVTTLPAPLRGYRRRGDWFLCGCRVEAIYGVSPLTPFNHCDLVALVTGDRLQVSLIADAVNLPDPQSIVDRLEGQVDQMVEASSQHRAS